MTVIGSKSTAPAQKTPEQLEHCQPSRADHQTAAAALATPNPNDGAACIHMPPPSERRRKRKATYHEYIAERIRPHCFHVPIMATKELSADFRRLRVPVALNAIVLLVDVGKLAYDCIRWDEVLATMVTMVIGSGMLWVLYMYCLGLYAPNAMLQPTGRGLMRGTLDEMAQLRRLLRAYMASIYLVMLQVMATWLLMGYLNWWPLRFGLDRPLMSFSVSGRTYGVEMCGGGVAINNRCKLLSFCR